MKITPNPSEKIIDAHVVESPIERLQAAGLLTLDGVQEDGTSLGVRIYRNFRESLLSGVLSVGDMLNTRPLAKALGISTMPVREAMSRLVADGGLEALANRAFRVPEITLSQFRELYLMRLRLETLAAEHAAARADAGSLVEISTAFEQMNDARSATLFAYLAAHRRFHFTVYRTAEMPVLFNAIETLWLRMGPVMNLAAELADVDEETAAHRALVSALHGGDPNASSRAIDEDLRLAGDRTMRFLIATERGAIETEAPITRVSR